MLVYSIFWFNQHQHTFHRLFWSPQPPSSHIDTYISWSNWRRCESELTELQKKQVSRWWESISVSKYPLTSPNNVNNSVWAGARAKMSTNDLLMDSFLMKRSQNGSLVSSSCTDFTTLLPQQHHDTPKFDDSQRYTASIALNLTHNNNNFPTTLLQSRTVSTFPYIFLQSNWTLCSSERTEPTLVWRTCVRSTQSKTIGSRELFIWETMLPSREKSVGLFKVAHGDLLGVMFDSVGDSKIRENRKKSKIFGSHQKIWLSEILITRYDSLGQNGHFWDNG